MPLPSSMNSAPSMRVGQPANRLAGQTFVAYHDFAPYFGERYQLKVAFVVESPS